MQRVLLLGAALLMGCVSSVPPPPIRVVEPVIEPVEFQDAWTARAGVTMLNPEAGGAYVLKPFSRLVVLGRDRNWLRVRCELCPSPVEGLLAPSDIVHRAPPPEIAAWGTLEEFALSIRTAAETRDLELLLPVMAPDFSYSLIGPQNPTAAFEVWRSEDFVHLDLVPGLLDQGLMTRDTTLWAAPPAHLEELNYRGPRVGFRRRPDGRWEWLYLMVGLRP